MRTVRGQLRRPSRTGQTICYAHPFLLQRSGTLLGIFRTMCTSKPPAMLNGATPFSGCGWNSLRSGNSVVVSAARFSLAPKGVAPSRRMPMPRDSLQTPRRLSIQARKKGLSPAIVTRWAIAALRIIVPECEMLRTSIVPECYRIRSPLKSTLKFGFRCAGRASPESHRFRVCSAERSV